MSTTWSIRITRGTWVAVAYAPAEDYEGAQRRELVLRNASGRRKRWLARAWRVSGKGNEYLNVDGYNIVVYPTADSIWGFRVTNRATKDAIQSRRPYRSDDAAKLRAFDAMIWMREEGGRSTAMVTRIYQALS
jgi:hypothetical protein